MIVVILIILVFIVLLYSKLSNYKSEDIRIIAISLPGSDRRPKLEEEMKKYNLKFEYSDGVRIKTYDDMKPYMEEFGIEDSDKGTKYLRTGDIGFTLAYIKAFKYIIDNNIEWTLLLEDDVNFIKEGIEHIDDYKVYEGWLVVHPNVKNNKWGYNDWGTHGQVVHINAIKKLWEKRQQLFDDIIYSKERQLLDQRIIQDNIIEWKDASDFGLSYAVDTYLQQDDTKSSERAQNN